MTTISSSVHFLTRNRQGEGGTVHCLVRRYIEGCDISLQELLRLAFCSGKAGFAFRHSNHNITSVWLVLDLSTHTLCKYFKDRSAWLTSDSTGSWMLRVMVVWLYKPNMQSSILSAPNIGWNSQSLLALTSIVPLFLTDAEERFHTPKMEFSNFPFTG